MVLKSSRDAAIPVNGKHVGPYHVTIPSSPLNITLVLAIWSAIEYSVLDFIAPFQDWSIFLPSCEANNLSYIKFAYFSYDIYSEFGTFPQVLSLASLILFY